MRAKMGSANRNPSCIAGPWAARAAANPAFIVSEGERLTRRLGVFSEDRPRRDRLKRRPVTRPTKEGGAFFQGDARRRDKGAIVKGAHPAVTALIIFAAKGRRKG